VAVTSEAETSANLSTRLVVTLLARAIQDEAHFFFFNCVEDDDLMQFAYTQCLHMLILDNFNIQLLLLYLGIMPGHMYAFQLSQEK